jgi:prepilin-type processing-associated H-X9-DG protein
MGDHDNASYRPGDVVRGQSWPSAQQSYPASSPAPAMLYNGAAIELYGAQCQGGIGRHHSHGGRDWIAGMPSQTVFNTLAPPNWKWPTCETCNACGWMDSPGVFPARSRHPGGANHALADGSVRMIVNTVAAQMYCFLGNREDGQPATLPP